MTRLRDILQQVYQTPPLRHDTFPDSTLHHSPRSRLGRHREMARALPLELQSIHILTCFTLFTHVFVARKIHSMISVSGLPFQRHHTDIQTNLLLAW
jgi:hypothetical protein